ncbi:MAG: hypothetical protein Kow0098_06930 [Ignavibacteriaceae bacterium]
MKPLICIYCEGNDTKIAAFVKEEEKIKVIRAGSVDVVTPSLVPEESLGTLKIEGDELSLDDIGKDLPETDENLVQSSIATLSNTLAGLNLSKSLFIPILTEPSVYYHIYEGPKNPKEPKLIQDIANEILETKNIAVDKESLGYIELADRSLLSVFVSGQIGCVEIINSLAKQQGRRNYKIPTLKSAELSLAYYVAKRKKFFPDDHSLIVYIGKEYSKLIFLHGRKLKHIGTTLDIGTANLHTYDVYFSKILLEMENGGISSLDNIIVCGEDDSENLILSFYGTFPEANVSRLEFTDIDTSALNEETKEKFSAYSVPVAVALEYFDELNNQYKGINLLPKYVKEEQKFFQFSWHSYLMLPVLFMATFFITQQILENSREIDRLDQEIAEKTILLRQNEEILSQIASIEAKISSFDQTQAILDSASLGTGIWKDITEHIADFCASKRNIWITKLSKENQNDINLAGYALDRNSITDFAYSIKSSVLKSVFFEELRDNNAYKFIMSFKVPGKPGELK